MVAGAKTGSGKVTDRAPSRDDEFNQQHFARRVQEFGADDHRSLSWGSREGQQLRFKVLAEVGELEGASVLDIGCGLGDLYGWLQQHNNNVDYTGIDITQEMISQALTKFPAARFEVRNLLHDAGARTYDYILESGIFTFRQNDGIQYFETMIAKMFSLCRRAIAFNALSSWAPEKTADEFYADPLATITFCRTLSPWVTLRHDYHNRDFTIYVYKERQA